MNLQAALMRSLPEMRFANGEVRDALIVQDS